jgi:hypothetical protein
MRGSLFVLLLLPTLPLLGGCHKYTPVRSEAVPVGATVRAHLTDLGIEQLEFVPRRNLRQVDGSLMRMSAQDLVLSIPLPASSGSAATRQLAQVVTLSRDAVVGLDLKEPDHTRSALAVGGIGAAFAVVVIKILSGNTQNEEEIPDDIPESRVPLWILRF